MTGWWLWGVLLAGTSPCLAASRNERAYSEFLPPVVRPQREQVMMQARRPLSLTCEGHKPVVWNPPASVAMSSRLDVSHGRQAGQHENPYRATLTLDTTVYTDTGSYICSFNGSSDLQAIDQNTAIHVYVYDEVHLLTHSGFDFQQSVQFQTATIPCTPTHPDVKIQLEREGHGPVAIDNKLISFSPRVGFLISPVMPEHGGYYSCKASYGGRSNEYAVSLSVLPQTSYVPPPHINRTSGSHVTMGQTLVLTCSVSVSWSVMVHLDWQLPNEAANSPRLLMPDAKARNVSVGGSFLKVVERQLQLHRVDKEDQGNYVCTVKDHSGNSQLKREYIRVYKNNENFLRVWQDGYSTLHKAGGREDSVQWVVEMASLPGPPSVTWFDPDGRVIREGEDKRNRRLVRTTFAKISRSMLKLTHLQLEDSGEYKVKVDNGEEQKWMNFTVIVNQEPIITTSIVEPAVMGLYQFGGHYTLHCTATGYPPPEITWSFRNCSTYGSCDGPKKHLPSSRMEKKSRVEMQSTLKVVASETGEYTCMGCNGQCQISKVDFYVTTLHGGFQVSGPTKATEGDSVDLLCAASRYNYTDSSLVWYRQKAGRLEEISAVRRRGGTRPSLKILDDLPSKFDVGKKLRFSSVSPEDSGVYVCQAKTGGPKRRSNMAETTVKRQLELRVQKLVKPHFTDKLNMGGDSIYVAEEGQSLELRCKVEGFPRPKMIWTLNDEEIDLESRTTFIALDDDQSIRIPAVVAGRTAGEYSCLAKSRAGEARLVQRVVQVEPPHIVKTNLFALEQTEQEAAVKVVPPGSTVNLTCQARGTPPPNVQWTLDGVILERASGLQYEVSKDGQNLVLKEVGPEQEGRYACTVTNIGGSQVRHRKLKIGEEDGGFAAFFGSNIAVPIIIAVSIALLLALLIVIIVRLCLTSCRSWKTPPSPPTPRLTQYELPEEGQETESCHLTLSRGGSPYAHSLSPPQSVAQSCHGCGGCQGTCHQCSACHYNYNGLYGCQGGSVMGVRGMEYCHTPLSIAPSHSPTSQAMSDLTQYSQLGGGQPLGQFGQPGSQFGQSASQFGQSASQFGHLGSLHGGPQLGLLTTVPGSLVGKRPVAPQPLYPSDLHSDSSQISAEF